MNNTINSISSSNCTTSYDRPPAAITPTLAVGVSALLLAILDPAFKPPATAPPIPTLVSPLATESGMLKVELLMEIVLWLSLNLTSGLGKSPLP